VPTTFTVKVHDVPAASAAPDRLTLLEPLAAVIVPPPHVPVKPLGDDTVNPDGIASVKPIPLSDTLLLGFESVNVRVVFPFNATLAPPNVFPMVGGSFTGGGEPPDDPPQPKFQSRLTTMKVRIDADCAATRKRRVMNASFYWG
jgi:hypothetical protein